MGDGPGQVLFQEIVGSGGRDIATSLELYESFSRLMGFNFLFQNLILSKSSPYYLDSLDALCFFPNLCFVIFFRYAALIFWSL